MQPTAVDKVTIYIKDSRQSYQTSVVAAGHSLKETDAVFFAKFNRPTVDCRWAYYELALPKTKTMTMLNVLEQERKNEARQAAADARARGGRVRMQDKYGFDISPFDKSTEPA